MFLLATAKVYSFFETTKLFAYNFDVKAQKCIYSYVVLALSDKSNKFAQAEVLCN